MKDYLLRLYDYNLWANKRILTVLANNDVKDEYCIKIFSHVLNAQFIWYRRITNMQNDYKIWDIWGFDQMHTAFEQNHQLWLAYLAELNQAELERSYSYSNSAGEYFESIVQDCLVHLVNHATYHRGQVAKQLRDTGVIPINTDFITYCREL